jgi:hypothetical protein
MGPALGSTQPEVEGADDRSPGPPQGWAHPAQPTDENEGLKPRNGSLKQCSGHSGKEERDAWWRGR